MPEMVCALSYQEAGDRPPRYGLQAESERACGETTAYRVRVLSKLGKGADAMRIGVRANRRSLESGGDDYLRFLKQIGVD